MSPHFGPSVSDNSRFLVPGHIPYVRHSDGQMHGGKKMKDGERWQKVAGNVMKRIKMKENAHLDGCKPRHNKCLSNSLNVPAVQFSIVSNVFPVSYRLINLTTLFYVWCWNILSHLWSALPSSLFLTKCLRLKFSRRRIMAGLRKNRSTYPHTLGWMNFQPKIAQALLNISGTWQTERRK